MTFGPLVLVTLCARDPMRAVVDVPVAFTVVATELTDGVPRTDCDRSVVACTIVATGTDATATGAADPFGADTLGGVCAAVTVGFAAADLALDAAAAAAVDAGPECEDATVALGVEDVAV